MSDYISREAALNMDVDAEVENEDDIDLIMRGMRIVIDHIKSVPSTGVEAKEAEWLYDTTSDMFACSDCGGLVVLDLYSYCPWCGAKCRK